MAEKRDESRWLITGSLVILAMVAIAVVLRYTSSVMIPFVLSLFIFSLVSPILDFQILKFKIPRPIAVIVTLLIILFIIAIISILVTQAVNTIIATVTDYTDNITQLLNDQIFPKLKEWHIDISQDEIEPATGTQPPPNGSIETASPDWQNRIETAIGTKLPKLVRSTFERVFNILTNIFLILIFVIFLLSGRNPHTVRTGVYADIDQNIRRYLGTKVLISTITGCLVWAALWLLGLKLAGVFGMFAFLLNFIPSIGSIIATLLPVPVAVAQFQNPWYVMLVVLLPGLVQMTMGNYIEPKLMGRGLNLHPITILLALFFWGLLWGITGMFLAAPMTAIIRIILMQFDTLRPLGKLLAGELPKIQTPDY